MLSACSTVQIWCNLDAHAGNSLIVMFSKFGSMVDARKTFVNMPIRNLFSWNSMSGVHVKCGEGQDALGIFQKMPSGAMKHDPVTLLELLKTCASVETLEEGKRVHQGIIQSGFESDIFTASGLIDMYAKCGSSEEARRVFDRMPIRSVMSWNAMLLGYVKCREGQKALNLSRKMALDGVRFDPMTFLGLLRACGSVGALEEGRRLHKRAIQIGYEAETVMGNSLVDMYAKCERLDDAVRIFEKMSDRSVVTWNTMIHSYVQCREGQKVLELFHQMQREGVAPNVNTFVSVLDAVARWGTLENAKRVHKLIIQHGCELNVSVANGVMHMYSRCGSALEARKVFNRMPSRNMVSWSTMLLGYANCGQAEKVLELSRRMRGEGLNPNPISFVAMLNACASTRALEEGKRFHEEMMEACCESEPFMVSSLVNMYVKCGSMAHAWGVFNMAPMRSVATWNAMIMGCASCGEERKSLDLFQRMEEDGVKPDLVTFVGLLKACGRLRVLEEGKKYHQKIIQKGFEFDISIGNGLIDMYGRCGSVGEARKVFDKMPQRNVYTWNNMILECARCGDEKSALGLSDRMQREENCDSFWGLLNISPDDGALEEGMRAHEQMMQRGCELDTLMGGSVVDMYVNGGSGEDVQRRALQRMLVSKGVT